MSIRWVKQSDSRAWYAYSGKFMVGMVGVREKDVYDQNDDIWWYVANISGRQGRGAHGQVKSLASAKRGVKNAWESFLKFSALQPK